MSVIKGAATGTALKKPSLARAEAIDKTTRTRLTSELEGAIKRKPATEAKLAGALRALAPLSPSLQSELAEAAQVLVARESFSRDLYGATMRTLAESDAKTVPALVKAALTTEFAGGNAALYAAALCRDSSLASQLAKLASHKFSHLAFAAETARVCRGESAGGLLHGIAPKIKESHRIAQCTEIFLPLRRMSPVPSHIGPALGVLRSAERHLGRWLVFASVATRTGDETAFREAVTRSTSGPRTSRAAWAWVAWALSSDHKQQRLSAPSARMSAELVFRLSDRPSAERDHSFLFSMAEAKVVSCKPLLEALVTDGGLRDPNSIRAAAFLARDHERADLLAELLALATSNKADALRGLVLASAWDAACATPSVRAQLRDLADELVVAKSLTQSAWGALVRAAHAASAESVDLVVTEPRVRWLEWGWLE